MPATCSRTPVFAVCLTRQQLVAVRRALIEHYAGKCKAESAETHEQWSEPEHGEHVHDAWVAVNRVINNTP